MINKKDHPELYAAKLRRFDRFAKKLIAERRRNFKLSDLSPQAVKVKLTRLEAAKEDAEN
jgi:hypothetical protein|tara:strand:- start:1334 stop:1513 length:180 start_codon:yes stop_codon:yes gene_type:complete